MPPETSSRVKIKLYKKEDNSSPILLGQNITAINQVKSPRQLIAKQVPFSKSVANTKAYLSINRYNDIIDIMTSEQIEGSFLPQASINLKDSGAYMIPK
jgi:hypothetical protein